MNGSVHSIDTVATLNKVVWAGPGLRWAAMGPHQLFHLSAGSGGLEEFCQRYGDSFHRWWDDLGDVRLTPEIISQLSCGVTEKSGNVTSETDKGEAHQRESHYRDQFIVPMLKGALQIRKEQSE